MILRLLPVLLLCAGLGCSSSGQAGGSAAEGRAADETNREAAMAGDQAEGPLGFVVKRIDGEDVPLSTYKGRVVLIVNVASKCGLTPQYADLQELHDEYAEEGLAVLGFPANNFAHQEPGSNEQIREFCTTNYGVEFDMFAKVSVKGPDKCPLYRYLTSLEKNGQFGGEITWNFTKFLIGRDGRLVARFEPRTKPSDANVIAAIEEALKGA